MRTGWLIALALAGLALAAVGVLDPGGGAEPGEEPASRTAAPRAGLAAPSADGIGGRLEGASKVTIGESAEGRPIRAVARSGLDNGPLVLVVGCIHGTECAGIEVAEAVRRRGPTDVPGVVVVPNLNPDGLSSGSRVSANGVDLNRNFATDWRSIGVPGDPQHSGPHPFSEPETRAARRLIRSVEPDVTIWFHQQAEPLVRAWGPSVAAARAYARLAGTPFRRLPWLEGTAPNWQNARFPGTSSFVVELALGAPSAPTVARHARAVGRLARDLEREGG